MMCLNRYEAGEMFRKIMERLDEIESKIVTSKQRVLPLDGDTLFDNQEMCMLLRVTKRTLARYRRKKLVSHYTIDGRTYYKASELQTVV